MKIRTLKNPEQLTPWDLKQSRWPLKSRASCRSKIQYESGQILLNKYPLDPILEDVTIPGSRLSLDFFLPHRMLAIEVQGVQHSEINSFFHKSKSDFQRQLNRDEDKRFFCELNDITLIEVTKPKQLEELLGATN